MSALGNYLRARRKQSQLSQKELAFLLGYKNESVVSRLERQERPLTFGALRACNMIFGADIGEMFPALSKKADDSLLQRIRALYANLEASDPSKRTEAKLRLLHAAMGRLTEGEVEHEIV